MACYGLPYTGSKNKLAEKIVKHFPEADTLVDVFFGGGAITHCAIVHNKFKNYIANDIRTTPQFFKDCIEGKYSNDLRWISAKDFEDSSRDDWFVRLCWSFSNNCNNYLYSRTNAPYKKAFHYAICFDDFKLLKERYPKYVCDKIKEYLKDIPVESWNERRLAAMHAIKELIKAHPTELTIKDFCCGTESGCNLQQNLERLNRLQNLENLQRINCCTHLTRINRIKNIEASKNTFTLDNITTYNYDYHLLTDIIPDNSVVYLDPPYKGTFDYSKTVKSTSHAMKNTGLFNTEEFLDWAYEIGKKHPTFISEYDINDDRFTLVDEWTKYCTCAGHSVRRHTVEKLYTIK